MSIIRNNTHFGLDKAGTFSVTLRQTVIVRINPEEIVLDTGGWFTATTKKRMNEALEETNQPWRVFQNKGNWYARNFRTDVELPFDGNVLFLPKGKTA